MLGSYRGFIGVFILLLIAYIFSTNRKDISPRVVISALLTQFAIGVLVFFFPLGQIVLQSATDMVSDVMNYGNVGAEFMFGDLVTPRMFEVFGNGGFAFALQVLPRIVYLGGLISVLYYYGIMQKAVMLIGTVFYKIIGVSLIESFAAVITAFVGQTELALTIKPYVAKLNKQELFAVMSSGVAATAVVIFAACAWFGGDVDCLHCDYCFDQWRNWRDRQFIWTSGLVIGIISWLYFCTNCLYHWNSLAPCSF